MLVPLASGVHQRYTEKSSPTTPSSSIRKNGARGGSRTHMRKNPRRILSPQRLPFRHPGFNSVSLPHPKPVQTGWCPFWCQLSFAGHLDSSDTTAAQPSGARCEHRRRLVSVLNQQKQKGITPDARQEQLPPRNCPRGDCRNRDLPVNFSRAHFWSAAFVLSTKRLCVSEVASRSQ